MKTLKLTTLKLLTLAIGLWTLDLGLWTAWAQTAVYFPLIQMTGATNDTTLTIRAVHNPVQWKGQAAWFPPGGITLQTVNGAATTNLIPNDYTVSIAGVPGAWRISVADTNVTLNAALIGNLTTYSFTDPTPGVIQLLPGAGNIHVSPANGKGAVTLTVDAVTNVVGTNGLSSISGNTLLNNTNYDPFGSAAAATNALGLNSGLAAFAPTNRFDAAGVGQQVSNAVVTIKLGTDNAVSAIVTNGSSGAVIQSACNVLGGVVWFQPGTYTLTNNISLTNVTRLIGNWAHLIRAPGLTNAMLDTGTNFSKQIEISQLWFDGGNPSANYNSTNDFFSGGIAGGNNYPYANPNWANQTGLRVDAAGGAYIHDNFFSGWAGQGFLALNHLGTGAHSSPSMIFDSNQGGTNFIGAYCVGINWEILGYYNNPFLDAGLGFGCEYSIWANNRFWGCQIGMASGGGNATVVNNSLNDNFIGIWLGDKNQQTVSKNSLQHDTFGAFFESANTGTKFTDNRCFATLAFYGESCNWLVFERNFLNQPSLIFSNCTGEFDFNRWDAGRWGIDLATNFSSGMRFYGNRESNGTNTDGSAMSLVADSNGGALTNLSASQLSGAIPMSAIPSSLGSLNSTGTISANLVISSNKVYYGNEIMTPQTLTGAFYDNHDTESPVNYPGSINVSTNGTAGEMVILIPNWATQVVFTVTWQWSGTGPGVTVTNQWEIDWFNPITGRQNNQNVQLASLLTSNLTDITFTNTCPDTNCLKTLRALTGFWGHLTNVTAPTRVLKWKVSVAGNVITTTNL